jgi:hypothetical protein
MAYQMMKGKKGNNDGFPSIPGMIARYSASGLTNESMAANPVWVDKTGNGRDLQLKNFSWKRMSGVGGYVTNKDIYEYDLDRYSDTFIESGTKVHDFYIVFELIGYDENFKDGFNLDARSISQGLKYRKTYTKNGIYIFQYKDEEGLDDLFAIGYNGNGGARSNFTVKILPLYPGALVFDGVDDYGTSDNFPILTKEKGYTVVALRQYLVEKSTAYLTVNGDSISNTSFIFEGNNYKDTWNFGRATAIQASRILATQTSKQYDGVKLNIGTNTEGSNLLQVGKWSKSYSNVAIWELVFLDHDATEEELNKIKDYFVKTYPWLFPDQAWTVTGKTNEDEDRATIANITGNGNNLVLSNFGFAEGSGYGLYAYNFNSFTLKDNVVKPTDVKNDSFRIVGTGNSSNVSVLSKAFNSANWKIRVTGMKEGDNLIVGNANKSGDYIKIIKDGTYTFQKQYAATSVNGIWYNSSQEVDVLVEQIPEYEGYLVTDGVDDKIVSSVFGMGKDFTVVGEWEFLKEDAIKTAGFAKFTSFRWYNYSSVNKLNMYIKTDLGIPIFSNSFKAVTSKGSIYLDFNSVTEVVPGDRTDEGKTLLIGYNGNSFTKLAFKNFAIYGAVLSKEDCIKAYNYLQTLKAK